MARGEAFNKKNRPPKPSFFAAFARGQHEDDSDEDYHLESSDEESNGEDSTDAELSSEDGELSACEPEYSSRCALERGKSRGSKTSQT